MAPGKPYNLQNIVEDLTPQLGGVLDTNSFDIRFANDVAITFGNAQDAEIFYSVGELIVKSDAVRITDSSNNDLFTIDKNDGTTIFGNLTLDPSAVTDITAAGGITVTNAHMQIQGDGGAVTVTADPQIAAGADGQVVYLHGSSDTNTVTLAEGAGIHLHSGASIVIGEHDHIMLSYDTTAAQWNELSSNLEVSHLGWAFSSPSGSFGTFYIGGFYLFGSASFIPGAGTTLGTANVSYGGHAFAVLGAASTDMIVRVTGTSITDDGTRTTSDTEDLDTSAGALNDYFETTKKWIGEITYSLLSGTGVAINNGMVKYWNHNNANFRLLGVEVTGLAGANDSSPDVRLLHHRADGWTYNAGTTPSPPSEIASMNTDHGVESEFVGGESFAWKRGNLTTVVNGGDGEGLICEIATTANKSVESLSMHVTIRPQ